MTTKERDLLNDLIRSIHALEEELMGYERKYRLLSDTFIIAFEAGEEPFDESWVLDWAGWAGAYQIMRKLQARYDQLVKGVQADSHTIAEFVRIMA